MVQVYHQDLQAWFQEHQDYAPFVDWLQQTDMSVLSYIELLSSNTPPNGLEVLAAMMALHFHITIIQGDQVWMSRPGEAQITNLTLLLLQEGMVFCDHINIVQQASLSESLLVSGVPFLGEQDVLVEQDSGDSGESLSNYYLEGQRVQSKMSINLTCPVCYLTAGSVLQLQEHLYEFHSDTKPYVCEQCSSTFLLFCDLRTHVQNMHQPSQFSCLKCTFSAGM